MSPSIEPFTSAPRLTKHRAVCSDEEQVKRLYEMDMRLSAAAYKALHMCEIVIRNAMDVQLRTWNRGKQGSEDWTLDPAPMLRACFKDDLDEAIDHAQKAVGKRNQPTHDDVVAQLNFGSWRYLIPGSNPHSAKDRVWDEALVKAFTNTYAIRTTVAIASHLSIAYDLRNRVAHHEPIFHLDLQAKRRNIRDVIDAVSRDAKAWFTENDQFGSTITDYQQFLKAEGISLTRK